MLLNASPTFGIVDYCVFIAMLPLSVGIGIYMSFKGNQSPEDYLMGNRAFGPIPITMSLVTSHISSISLLGYSGEVYGNGLQPSLIVIGGSFGIIFASILTLPVFFPLKLTSVNEYIELRFKSPKLRGCLTILACIKGFIYMGICLYAPTIALASITPLDSMSYIFLLGIVCSIYSTIGGIRAIVWTDVLQLTVMMVGLIAVTALGWAEVGGFGKVWSIASEGGRTELFNMNPSIYERHSFYNTLLVGFTLYSAQYSISQINIQRMCSVRTLRDAKLITLLSLIGILFIYFFVFTNGLMVFASYYKCDPLMQGKIKRKEAILPYYIIDRLGYIPGLPGLFAATIVGGALSTLSSVISAQVAMIWMDTSKLVKCFENASPKVAAIITKVLSMLVCAALIGMAIFSSKASSLIQYASTIGSIIYGPIFGVFLLGLLFPRCNVKGVWCGLLISLSLLSWICLGSLVYGERILPLPFSTQECNLTTPNITDYKSDIISHYNLNSSFSNDEPLAQEPLKNNFPLMNLYAISYTYYPFCGIMTCIVVGMIVSYFTGLEDVENVPPELTATFIRRFYWKQVHYDKKNCKSGSKLTIYNFTENKGKRSVMNIPHNDGT